MEAAAPMGGDAEDRQPPIRILGEMVAVPLLCFVEGPVVVEVSGLHERTQAEDVDSSPGF